MTDNQRPTPPDPSQSARPKGRAARPRQPVIRHRPAEAARSVRTRGQDPLLSGKGPLALSSIHSEVAQFTAKVHHCTKGWVDQCLSDRDHAPVCDQVVGFAGNIRSVVVTRRSPRRLDHELLLREQLQQQEARSSEADQARLRLEAQRDEAGRALSAHQRRALLAVMCALGLGFSAGGLVGWRLASPGLQLTESAVVPPGRSNP